MMSSVRHRADAIRNPAGCNPAATPFSQFTGSKAATPPPGCRRPGAIEYLDLDDVLGLVRTLGVGPVTDLGLLDSAVARPRSSPFGEDAYPTVALKAAALLHSLTNNHALVDGNKRLAWLATVVFLDIGGSAPELRDGEAFDLVWEVASTSLDVERIASTLKVHPRD
jgi:death on curing protein